MRSGLFTTVQDRGRYGCLRYGVPISGAMDEYSFTVANLLVDNNPDAACLETTLIGPQLQALNDLQAAVTGGECELLINGSVTPMWQTLEISKDDIVTLGKMRSGCRSYLAIRGGIDVPLVLGSRSTYLRGGFGGMNGQPLSVDDVIERFHLPRIDTRLSVSSSQVPKITSTFEAHCLVGPQADMFDATGIDTFFSCPYVVTSESDRMGYRLRGSLIAHKDKADIVSDALLPGTVQVPKNGQPILIMRDAQTTGGYPKIATVITSDISMLGQAKPNNRISFSEITLEDAYKRLNEYRERLRRLASELKKQ